MWVEEGHTIISTKTTKLIVIALTVAALTLAATTLAAININRDIPSSGSVITTPDINVYSNRHCTENLTSIDWGSIEAGCNTTKTIYVKNTGTETLTLSLTTNNWTPVEADGCIAISWDGEGTHLTPEQSTSATLTLIVASEITDITNFSNSITISGTT